MTLVIEALLSIASLLFIFECTRGWYREYLHNQRVKVAAASLLDAIMKAPIMSSTPTDGKGIN